MNSVKTEDAEDHEIFDINDFTTASDWERFIVQIEELINEWKLNTSSSLNENLSFEHDEWKEKSEILTYADEISFTITLFSLCSKSASTSSTSSVVDSNKKSLEIRNDEMKRKLPQTTSYYETSLIDFDSVSQSQFQTNDQSNNTSNNPHASESSSSFDNLVSLPPKSMADLLNRSNDFEINLSSANRTPNLAYWFGISKFLLITPTRSNVFIDNESRARVILMSASVAINNTGCTIPIFVQIQTNEREIYFGLCEGSALKTHFQIVHFSYIPPQYAYLPGLLEIFKSKLGNHINNPSLLVSVSVRFTYLIEENTFLDYQSSSPAVKNQFESYDIENDTLSPLENNQIEIIDGKNKEEIYPKITQLTIGSILDCIDSISLSCIWSNLSEDIIIDSESFSDLSPYHSNDWSLTINTSLDKCEFQLTSLLTSYIEEHKRTISVNQLISNSSANSSFTDIYGSTSNSNIPLSSDQLNEELKKSSLHKLTTSKSATRRFDRVYNLSSNMIEKATNKIKIGNLNDILLPLDKDFIEFIMEFIFPDSKSGTNNVSQTSTTSTNKDAEHSKIFKSLSLLKSSSLDNKGLLNRLVTCLSLVNTFGQTRAVAQLWREFLLELRFRYDSSIFIPDVYTSTNSATSMNSSFQTNSNAPDLSRCLLHQKLQMLNCCIKKRVDRQAYETRQTMVNNENNEDEEDEFFDCDDELETNNTTAASSRPKTPEGRLKKFENLTLLNKPSEFIYVPITQEPTPMTEDMIEQHANVLVNLGSSDDAALLRAKIQSASLLSDMQSFKAANPECVLEDFVRWYSPRDWIEMNDEVVNVDAQITDEKLAKKYGLSQRMKIPGNVWIETWESAQAVPVRRQKRLFDDTKEAENVFEWLNSLSIGQIIEQTLPILFFSCIYECYEKANSLQLNQYLTPVIESLLTKSIKITRSNEANKYHDLLSFITTIEQMTSFKESLDTKFANLAKNKMENEALKELTNKILNSLSGGGTSLNETSCNVKIDNGAHSLLGKLITRLWLRKRKKLNKSSRNKTDQKKHKYQEVDEDDVENEDEYEDEEQIGKFKNKSQPEKPYKREYILRSSVSRPAPFSRQSPQRMYVLLTKEEFRLAGAFTEDTMFF